MKTLIIIFGLLYGSQCRGQLSDYDYFDRGDYDDNYDEYHDPENYEPNSIVSIVTKGETFVKNLTETVLLPCDVSPTDNVLFWKRNNLVLYQSHVRMGAPENYEELLNGTLKITNLTAEDAGEYICTALVYSDPNRNPKITHTLKINVPPKIISLTTKGNRTVLVNGDTLSLHCQATGYPVPVISWHKGGEGLPAEGEDLIVSNVKDHNAGEYSCMADNQIGEPDVQTISINLTEKLFLIIDQTNLSSHLHEDCELRCMVQAEPAVLFWMKDGVVIENSERHVLSYKNDTLISLVIKRLEESDFGIYYCYAFNSLGGTSKNVTLVKTPPEVQFRTLKSENKELVLLWEVQSKSPITRYEVDYRRKGEYKWEFIRQQNTTDNKLNTFNCTLSQLAPGEYETRIKYYNAHGWSDYSEIMTFEEGGHHYSYIDKKSSGCSSVSSAATLLNVVSVVIFLMGP